jgi:Tol biopolymer transport system component
MPLVAGTRLGVYEIGAPLGAGGMGEVYRAHDTKLGRGVAIKVLTEAFAFDPDRIGRFEREAKVLASLNHPYIAALHGMEESGGRHFLVMELVEGETLADRIAGTARGRSAPAGLDVDDALRIARQIAEALEAAHEKGIVHRDLKPANVKITPDDGVKVLDFGLAKAMGPPETGPDSAPAGLTHSPTLTFAGATQAGMILGTAPYMSPEQAKGRTADNRSDVWAFGCVLYEMLTGRRAFEGDDVSETLASVIKSDPDWRALPQSVPHAIRALIQGCLKKDRKERIGDISTALFLLAQPHAPAPDAAATLRQRPPLWRRAMLVAAGVAIGAAASVVLLSRPRPAAPAAVTRFVITLPQGQQLTLPRQAVAISPDGTQIAYSAAGRLYLRLMSDVDTRLIAGADPAVAPEFSPDGQSLLFWAGSMLKRIAVSGGSAVTVCPTSTAPSGITWRQNAILFGQPGVGVVRVSPAGGQPEVLVPLSFTDGLAHRPELLPDGDSLLFTIARRVGGADPWDNASIVLQSLKTGQRRTLIERGTDGRYVPTGHIVYAVGGTLFAVPFDLGKRALSGGPVPIVEGVRRVSAAQSGAAHFAFSASGSLVYVPGPSGVGQQDLMLFDRKGGAEPLKLPPGSYAYPRASPDGKRLAFETADGNQTNVSIYDLSGASSVRRLTFGGNNRYPIWSSDGRRVAFQSDREGEPAVFWQPADGGTAERLTKPETGTSNVPESWSPAGDTFLFSAARGSEISLWTFSIRDRKATRFSDVTSITLPTNAAFSPDGRWVAYQGAEVTQGEGTMYVEPFPPDGTKYEIGRGGRAVWSRDGTELFYVPAPSQFMAVKVTTRPTFTFSSPVAVHRGFGVADPSSPRPYDILPDGRFVGVGFAGVDQTLTQQIQVVLNWFADLKARVPTK